MARYRLLGETFTRNDTFSPFVEEVAVYGFFWLGLLYITMVRLQHYNQLNNGTEVVLHRWYCMGGYMGKEQLSLLIYW